MKNGITDNKRLLIDLLMKETELTRQDIARSLHLSMPTTLQVVNDLLNTGVIEERGNLESTGGRKAKMLGLAGRQGVTVGIDIGLHQIRFVAMDLAGERVCCDVKEYVFAAKLEHYRAIAEMLEGFLRSNHIVGGRVLGVGISFPGIIDEQRNELVWSHILDIRNVNLDRFQNAISYPVLLVNDANSAGYMECKGGKTSYIYLSLNESVGGAIVENGRLRLGDTYQAGEFGHMLLLPRGKKCYCGKCGCADAYLSPNVLTDGDCETEEFFLKLESGDQTCRERWEEYLDWLAIMITNLRMSFDMDVIIGGAIGKYIAPWLDDLKERAEEYDRFVQNVEYIYPCVYKDYSCADGAARIALERYAERVLE